MRTVLYLLLLAGLTTGGAQFFGARATEKPSATNMAQLHHHETTQLVAKPAFSEPAGIASAGVPDTSETDASSVGPHSALSSSVSAPSRLPESSVYHVDSDWTMHDGSSLPWSTLQGRKRLVAFFFTHCGYACPRIVHDLKDILSNMPHNDDRAVGVVLVSIDPEHDTTEALQGFAATHGLEQPQWTLLRSSDRDVRELAAVLGARYKKQPSGEFAHTNTIVLLNEEGEIAARRDGTDEGVDAILAALGR